jgi:FixJ family two-component response regulator
MTPPADKGIPAVKSNSVVIIVDDDEGIRVSLDSLFRSIGLETRLFGSPAELLGGELPDGPGCIVLDVRLPGVSGLDLQGQLMRQGIEFPIIFMTGHGDIPMSVRAMKAGAVDFLSKPFRDQDLLDAVATAIQRDQKRREQEKELAELKAHFETLTPREREIMALVASGLMSKQIAAQIDLSEITVKVHRSHIMKKMGARTVADLVRMSEALGVHPGESQAR